MLSVKSDYISQFLRENVISVFVSFNQRFQLLEQREILIAPVLIGKEHIIIKII